MDNISFLYEILMGESPTQSISNHLEKLLEMIPELKYEIGFQHQHPHHHLDVWNHTLLALSLSEEDFDIRLALLLHDIGKPFCYTEREDIRHYQGHPKVSQTMTIQIMRRLGFSKNYIKKISYLVLKHDTPISQKEIEKYPNITFKRYEIQRCDALAHHPDKLEKRKQYLDKVYEKIKRSQI